MLYALSAVVLVLLALGVYHRCNREIHMKLMLAAFGTDLALLLYIEGTRHAIKTVIGSPPAIVLVHAAISLTVLALYVGQIALARKMDGNTLGMRRAHAALGAALVTFRVANFATSFFVGGHSA